MRTSVSLLVTLHAAAPKLAALEELLDDLLAEVS